MSLIDSKAAFQQRCGELSTTTISLFDQLAAQNISSFSELAFECGTPNRPPSDEEFKALADSVLGGGASAGQTGLLRRLHFEAATLVLSQLKTAVTSETSEGIKKLPFAEKQARYARVKASVSGFLIQGAAPKDNQQVLKIESQTLKVSTEGSSNLTIEIRKANLRGVAIDKTVGRAKGPITVLDLTVEEDVAFLSEFIRQEANNICLIHFAPPCGTCSAARKRRLAPAVLDRLASDGITPPQILRSEAFPTGLPNLRGLDAMKDLSEDERKLHDGLSNHVKQVLQGKRLLLLRDILEDLDYPDKISLAALLKSSAGLQKAARRRVVEPEDTELHAAAWEETRLEEERGWIWPDDSGIFKEKIIAHRFGIRQGDKVRVSDNFKQCGLNDSCGLPEKFVLHGVDYIAEPRLFGLNALPFGATGSVAGFLRVSSALFFVLSVGLKIWCSAFFDDFPTLSGKILSDNTERCVGLLFDLLGIQYAQSGKKCQQFSEEMRALGLVFDLSQFGKGKVFIKHTPERKQELTERLEEILTKGSLTPKEAESLKGRVQWYESYLFGRIANLAVHRIGKRALSKMAPRDTKLDAELKAALTFLKERVSNGLPLELTAETENALLIFTDGAFESTQESGSVGGILFDEQGNPLRFFAEVIPDILMKSLMKEAVNPIYLIELLAAYLAVFLWGGLHPARYVVSYIDNEASRLALIKAYSSTELGNVMVQMFVHLEDSSQWKIWFGRVGSHSNPSDAPSRMQVEDLIQRGVVRDSVAWDVVIMSYEETLHMLGRG
ncbi:unnamed protein product [Cladocopium goreaui]|uniref:RNase H type-1 domain-containing protein n=1 Tax=Cladocopium goreaui TaxID=2562237 RepID=A0A9P1FQP3_9DINO|nr:unnamed protein product [Cladocopium goreaui]